MKQTLDILKRIETGYESMESKSKLAALAGHAILTLIKK